jgi:hypothetical protein
MSMFLSLLIWKAEKVIGLVARELQASRFR